MTKLLVHIGLPKTGTTTLQSQVFPNLEGITYNPKNLMYFIRKHHLFGLDHDELDDFHNQLKACSGTILISNEALVGWDPYDWANCLRLNLELFGKDAKILITLREPVSYLRSIYQQRYTGGLRISEDDFFIPTEKYWQLKKLHSNKPLHFFDINSLNYAKLLQIYKETFTDVSCFPINQHQKFLEYILNISGTPHCFKPDQLMNLKLRNTSTNDLGMSYLKLREFLLSSMDLASLNPEHRIITDWCDEFMSLDNYLRYQQPSKSVSNWFFSRKWITNKILPLISDKKYSLKIDTKNMENLNSSKQFYESLHEN